MTKPYYYCRELNIYYHEESNSKICLSVTANLFIAYCVDEAGQQPRIVNKSDIPSDAISYPNPESVLSDKQDIKEMFETLQGVKFDDLECHLASSKDTHAVLIASQVVNDCDMEDRGDKIVLSPKLDDLVGKVVNNDIRHLSACGAFIKNNTLFVNKSRGN